MSRTLAAALLAALACGVARAQDPQERALDLNEAAVARFQAGDLPGALALFRQALLLAPREEALRLNTSRCLIALGDESFSARRFPEAARDYHEAAGLCPDDPEPALREALALHEGQLDRDAVALLEPLLARFPTLTRGFDLLARSCYRLGENARAIRAWEALLRLEPGNAEAQAALERARREEAVEGGLYEDLGAQHFAIKYDGGRDLALGRRVAQALEAAYEEVGRALGRYPRGEVAVVIYPARTFRATTGAHGWVAGLYDGKIRVPAQGLGQASDAEVRRVLTHEYTHALLRAVGGPRVPIWLHEGLAQVMEGGGDPSRGLTQANAPSLAELTQTFAGEADAGKVALRYGAARGLVTALLGQGGTPSLVDLLERLGRNEPLEQALLAVYGQGLDAVYAAWRARLPR